MGIKIEKVNKKEYKLLEDITVDVDLYKITVKNGFVFDGASIPRVFWNIVGSPFTGNYTKAALIHDALYISEILSRKKADAIFLKLMKQYGVSYLKRYVMYLAVRAGGGAIWNKHKKQDLEKAKAYIKVKEKKR